MPGPPPKRSDQRRRRNATPGLQRVDVDAKLRGPALGGDHTRQAREWYQALRRSRQAAFYEPSDWAQASLVAAAIDAFVRRPSAALLAGINTACISLLVTEGDRRRLHLELEKRPDPESERDAAIADLAAYRGSR